MRESVWEIKFEGRFSIIVVPDNVAMRARSFWWGNRWYISGCRSFLLGHTSNSLHVEGVDVLLLDLFWPLLRMVLLCVYVFWWSQRSPLSPSNFYAITADWNLMLLRNAGWFVKGGLNLTVPLVRDSHFAGYSRYSWLQREANNEGIVLIKGAAFRKV